MPVFYMITYRLTRNVNPGVGEDMSVRLTCACRSDVAQIQGLSDEVDLKPDICAVYIKADTKDELRSAAILKLRMSR